MSCIVRQAHLLSWCLWRGQSACSGCREQGGGAPHRQPALLHLSLTQGWGWWGAPFGSGIQGMKRRNHSFPVALSFCSGTWRSQSEERRCVTWSTRPDFLNPLLVVTKHSSKRNFFFMSILKKLNSVDFLSRLTCPGTVGIGDQKYDELKWESSIISAMTKNAETIKYCNDLERTTTGYFAVRNTTVWPMCRK